MRGNNYWTFGPPTELRSSSRFDPTSNLYQAWFGIYTQLGKDKSQFGFIGKEPDIKFLKRLAEVDQEYWLKAYGDKNPTAQLMSFESKGRLRVDGRKAWLYYGEINSHSDVGFSGKGYEGAYGTVRSKRFISDEVIDSRLFTPDPKLWSNYVDAYHNINLRGFFTVVPLENTTVCIYLNGAEYQDRNGRHYDTWPKLEREAVDMIQSVKIELLHGLVRV